MKAGVLVVSIVLAGGLAAQEPDIRNARMEFPVVGGGLEGTVKSIASSVRGVAWIGYSVPMVEGRHGMCCYSRAECCTGCSLEGQHEGAGATEPQQPVKLDQARLLQVLFRVENRQIGKIRSYASDCHLDAGGATVYWLWGAAAAESIRLLAGFVAGVAERGSGKSLGNAALTAIAFHAGPEAEKALGGFIAAGQPLEVRKQSAFWLGVARGQRGYEMVRDAIRKDSDDRFRKEAVFALNVSQAPGAVTELIRIAKQDASSKVRSQALFWLAQKAGKKAAETVRDAIDNDPDTAVKKQAVFALSQLPKDEGVPLLIDVAQKNPNREVRKQAMFWLGQSNDARALKFIEEVLTQ